MKKNILFLIAFAFAITIKACENKAISSIVAYSSGLYAETRNEAKTLTERMRQVKMGFHFKNVTLTLLDPKVMLLPENHGNKKDSDKMVELLELKQCLSPSYVSLRATLIDNNIMESSIQGLLLALFSAEESFIAGLKQQVKNENVYFKISGESTQQGDVSEFYFKVPSEKIISDCLLEQQSKEPEKLTTVEISEKNGRSSSWVKYTVPFGLLAILTVWYFFKYKS